VERQNDVHKIIIPLCFIIFLSVLNGTMFQVAIPDISHEFNLLPSEVSWVMTGYILIFAVGALIYGKLADIYPEKTLITWGLLLMNAGSLAGLFAKWYPVLIAARLLQAGGGAAVPALAMIVVTRYFEHTQRGRVLGIIASTVALAAGLGPVAGGFIAGTFHWKYLFILSLATRVRPAWGHAHKRGHVLPPCIRYTEQPVVFPSRGRNACVVLPSYPPC
jgi:DHA2 family metal-tetracycline-proton antiporter-like MFS transporter